MKLCKARNRDLEFVYHIVMRNNEPDDAWDITACGVNCLDFNSPELGECEIVYNSTLPPENVLCPECLVEYNREREKLLAWGKR